MPRYGGGDGRLASHSCMMYRCERGPGIACVHSTSGFEYNYEYLRTPWSRVLLEKLTGSAASQEIPRIFGT